MPLRDLACPTRQRGRHPVCLMPKQLNLTGKRVLFGLLWGSRGRIGQGSTAAATSHVMLARMHEKSERHGAHRSLALHGKLAGFARAAAVRRSAVAGAARGLERARRPPSAPGALVGPARPPPGRAATSRAAAQPGEGAGAGAEGAAGDRDDGALGGGGADGAGEPAVHRLGSMMVWDERLKEGDKARVCITMAYRQ